MQGAQACRRRRQEVRDLLSLCQLKMPPHHGHAFGALIGINACSRTLKRQICGHQRHCDALAVLLQLLQAAKATQGDVGRRAT